MQYIYIYIITILFLFYTINLFFCFKIRNGSSRRSSPYSRHDSKNPKRLSRSKSKEKYSSSHNYFLEKKANTKRQSKYFIIYFIIRVYVN